MTWALKHSDNFNRANENPIAAPWEKYYLPGGEGQLLNNAYANLGGYDYAYYDDGNLGLNQRIVAKCLFSGPVVPNLVALFLRCAVPWDEGSQILFNMSTNVVNVTVNGVTQGASVNITLVSGDILDASIIGNTVTLKQNGNVILTRELVNPPTSRYIAIGAKANAGQAIFDDVEIYEEAYALPGSASSTAYQDVSGRTLHVTALRPTVADPTVLEYYDLVAGIWVPSLTDNCKAAMDEVPLDGTQSLYTRTTAEWPSSGYYGVFDESDAALTELNEIGAASGSVPTVSEIVAAIKADSQIGTPAKAGDAMALTAEYDAAKSAAAMSDVENALLGQRSWDKGALTETVKRVDGTTAKVFNLTVDATGDVVDKIPRP